MVDVRLLGAPDARAELAKLHDVAVNYELDGTPSAGDGWSFDDYCQKLAVEQPGPPEPGGPFEVACRLVRDYEFADPSIIQAVWLPETPLDQRDMLLSGRFGPLRFLLGVRVSSVVDEEVVEDGRPLRAYGWCYRTLHGHLEAGEMCYRVVKLLDTGEVQFRVCRYVRTGRIRNPLVRLGWATFGRAMQVLFVHRSMSRMRRLVEAELLAGGTGGVRLAATRIEVNQAGPEQR